MASLEVRALRMAIAFKQGQGAEMRSAGSSVLPQRK